MSEILSSITVVAAHNGEIVALPIQFPSPKIDACVVKHVNIVTNNGEGRHIAIISPTGQVYELSRRLKEAIYGAVHCGVVLQPTALGADTYVRTDMLVAVKIVSKEKLRVLRGKCQEDPLKEFAALQYISTHPTGRHPNIVYQIECLQDDKHFFSILEFVHGGELYDFVDDNGAMSEEQARPILRQIVDGLLHLQSINVCHRDISLENIMRTHDGVIKIIDFGMALLLPRHPDTCRICLIPRQGQCGKRNYMAPEVVESVHPFNGLLVDVWATGIILFILLTGVPPCETASPLDSRYRMIASQRIGEMLQQWSISLASETVAFVQCILRHIPNDRISAANILSSNWLNR